ncbi:serpentine receptor, putative [Hepatocystis sp. ex Piliocolobus tephrosceles]|nr:serpentine receptor, putative [Hepatocystis sp. ex Piliocolobus tephrosceles]
MAKSHKLKVTVLPIFFFVLFTGIHTVFTVLKRKDWVKFYLSCLETKEVTWDLLFLLNFVNSLLLLLNVNYKNKINTLNKDNRETSDINDDLINIDMHEFSNNDKDNDSSDESEKGKILSKVKLTYLYEINNSKICYYSLWILSYYLIYFLCFMSFLYGIRIFNNNLVNIYTLRTCRLDLINNYIISEDTFISFYWVIINFNVFISKYMDPLYIANYIKCKINTPTTTTINSTTTLTSSAISTKKKVLFCLHYIYQIILISYTIYTNVSFYKNGINSLSQIVCALIFLFLILYTILEITWVLEINRPFHYTVTTLPYNYIWAIIYLFIVFMSSVIFYLSAFTFSIKDQFLHLQLALWVFFIALTRAKRKQLFIRL